MYNLNWHRSFDLCKLVDARARCECFLSLTLVWLDASTRAVWTGLYVLNLLSSNVTFVNRPILLCCLGLGVYCLGHNSLTHCCAWPAEGRSVLHIEREYDAVSAYGKTGSCYCLLCAMSTFQSHITLPTAQVRCISWAWWRDEVFADAKRCQVGPWWNQRCPGVCVSLGRSSLRSLWQSCKYVNLDTVSTAWLSIWTVLGASPVPIVLIVVSMRLRCCHQHYSNQPHSATRTEQLMIYIQYICYTNHNYATNFFDKKCTK